MKKFLSEKMNSAKYEAVQTAKTTFKYLKEVRNNKLIQAIKEGKSNEQLKRISIDTIVDEIKFAIMSKGYEGRLENFDVDLFIFKNFRRSLFSVTATDLKVIRAAIKSFNNVQRIRLDEFNFINVEYISVVEEPVAELEPVESVAEEPKEEAITVEAELVPNETLPVLNDEVTDVDAEEIEELEAAEVPQEDISYITDNTTFEVSGETIVIYCDVDNVSHLQMILFKYKDKRNNLFGDEYLFKDIHLTDDNLFNIELQ
mgnify:CR=1 FL=1